MRFSAANVQGSIVFRDGVLFVRIEPSGCINERPFGMNDWLVTDFKARPRWWFGHWFHRGFLDAWLKVEVIVEEWIQRERPRLVVLDGLSMGGAVSGVGAALLAQAGHTVKHKSYGAPRFLFGEKTRAWFDSVVDSTRHVYGEDLVTKMPPKWLGYRHGGNLEHTPRAEKWSPFAMIKDHFPKGYDIAGWAQP